MPAREKLHFIASKRARFWLQPPLRKIFLIFSFITAAIFLFYPGIVFGATFTFSDTPATIDEGASFSVKVTIEGLTAGNKYYLRAAFFHPGTPSSYFGYTKNNSGVWYNGKPSPLDHTQFFQIVIDPDKTWSGWLEVKPDPKSSAYQGEGDYHFKIGRYTEAGSGPTWTSDTVVITIVAMATPTPSLSPLPTSTSTPTPTPSPAQATYQINDVKDQAGNILAQVKIYVDGNYIHHYAPETLIFCDGCQCADGVQCGFGEHLIRLEKTGFENWLDKRTITSGAFYQVEPIMVATSFSPTPTSTPPPIFTSPSPTPTLSLLSALTPFATRSLSSNSPSRGSVLGEERNSTSSFYPWEATPEAKTASEATTPVSLRRKTLPLFFLGLGLGLLFLTAFYLWYNFDKGFSG